MKSEKQNKNETVLKFRAKRYPTVAGLPRDFAQTRRDELERIRAEIQRASRDNARAAGWAFVSGMAWTAVVFVFIYQLTGSAA